MSSTTTLFMVLVHETCCECGVGFGLEQNHQAQLRRNHADFYCPNGHRQHYTGETEAERLKREKTALEQQLERVRENRDWQQQLRFKTERRLIAQRAATTKAKRRAAAGTCQCCQRTFQNVAEHMRKQHPEYVKSAKLKKIP